MAKHSSPHHFLTSRSLTAIALGIFTAIPLSAADGFPTFRWDRVPLYAHVGIGEGLEQAQYEFLADRFQVVTMEGGLTKGSSVEGKFAEAARVMKMHNPAVKVIAYWASDMPKHQWRDSNASFPKDGHVRAEKAPESHRVHFDVRRPDVRGWWSDIAARMVSEHGCDGIFVDGITAGTPGGPWSRYFGQEQASAMDEGTFAMMQQAREKMGPGKLILFNPLHASDGRNPGLGVPYLPVTDGAMVDDFDRATNVRRQSPEYLARTIELMQQTAADGKIVIFKAWPGFTWWSDPELMKKPHAEQHRVAQERLTFPLACYLAGAAEHCYFCYTWGWLAEYGTFDWYPEFDRPLGPPKGQATREGWTFRREFEHASVFVDVETKTAKIDWK